MVTSQQMDQNRRKEVVDVDYFYSLVAAPGEMKKRRCLKCGISIRTKVYRLCSQCRMINNRMGKIYATMNKDV